MEFFKKSVLLFAAMLTLAIGAFPPNSVICQAVNGDVIIEGSCNCESEKPPCCSEGSCHEDSENKHENTVGSGNDCVDTLISVENYTEQNLIIIDEQFYSGCRTYGDYISLIAGHDFPLDIGKQFYSDPPDLIPSQITIIKSTVLII